MTWADNEPFAKGEPEPTRERLWSLVWADMNRPYAYGDYRSAFSILISTCVIGLGVAFCIALGLGVIFGTALLVHFLVGG